MIGASAGGVEATRKLLSELPDDLAAAVLIVIHTGKGPNQLSSVFQRVTRLKLMSPTRDRHAIKNGSVYLAPPNCHMLVNDGHICLSYGPRENLHRPAIDPLFRSAANARGRNVIGVVLSGNLDDGAAGLLAIKECGGITLVQTPEDALFPGMPRNALERVEPDHVVPLAKMGPLLARLTQKPPPRSLKTIPTRVKIESDIADLQMSRNKIDCLGKPSQYACPDCHGVLWEMKEGGQLRFRCRVGHAYSLESLHEAMTEGSENALWIALRALEEKVSLLQRLAEDSRKRQGMSSARHFERRSKELLPATHAIRALLVKISEKESELK
ncbi:MAG TPA: chemotaxis protein CheB [Verrucomicrobiae bacterium]|nr:chemotaxis protein CheB [Verrucomicrobiae bacterium]